MDLYKWAHMSAERIVATIVDLKRQHQEYEEWCRAEVRDCQANLLACYHNRKKRDVTTNVNPKHPLTNTFTTLVFSLHFVNSVIETYFSKTRFVYNVIQRYYYIDLITITTLHFRYIKNEHRSRLRDELSSTTLHMQQLKVVVQLNMLYRVYDNSDIRVHPRGDYS